MGVHLNRTMGMCPLRVPVMEQWLPTIVTLATHSTRREHNIACAWEMDTGLDKHQPVYRCTTDQYYRT